MNWGVLFGHQGGARAHINTLLVFNCHFFNSSNHSFFHDVHHRKLQPATRLVQLVGLVCLVRGEYDADNAYFFRPGGICCTIKCTTHLFESLFNVWYVIETSTIRHREEERDRITHLVLLPSR